MEIYPEVKLRIRVSANDVHYAGELVDGAHIMKLFGDVATELTIRYDGDEGLLRAYERSTVPAAVPNCVLAGDARQNETNKEIFFLIICQLLITKSFNKNQSLKVTW